MKRRSVLAGLALATFAGASRASLAQSFPSRPIRLVVGYSPGGGNDLIARIVAAKLQERLGQPVIVENKAGAQSIIAAELVARAPADGYTLLVAPSGPMTINPAVYRKLPYAPAQDFAPISLMAEFPLMLAVGAQQPIKSVAELVAQGKADPKMANYASSATPFQLAAELFNQKTGSAFQHIPYRGSGESVNAVVSGTVLMTIADSGPMSGPLKGGLLRALAITASKRHRAFPDVPTMAEAGISGMEITLWTGLVAPVGTPADIVAKLQAEIAAIVALPDVKERFEQIAVDPRSTTPDEYRALIASDIARWKAVADTANIKLD
jgi:tripartite-type tricarboxylate transporter receptor subunit TctC